MGTSLALVGAYVLGGELAAGPDHGRAFARYETIMRPYAARAQKLPPGTPGIANPRSRAGVAAFHGALRVVSRLGALQDRFFSPPADTLDLPVY
jgi:2-polyprenyl-6-methoxyphenol hydroxylase-like FAD-dependent oxidoreductase